jgi:hypothetical protein
VVGFAVGELVEHSLHVVGHIQAKKGFV